MVARCLRPTVVRGNRRATVDSPRTCGLLGRLLPVLFFRLSLSTTSLFAADVVVHDADELLTALADAVAGTTIVLADGSYETTRTLRLKSEATSKRPIVVRAENDRRATISGRFGLLVEKSAHVLIEGLKFEHSNHSRAIEIKHSTQVRVRNCTFRLQEDEDQSTHWVYVTGSSSHVVVSDCLFEEKHRRGCFVTLGGTEEDDEPPNQVVRHCTIADCTFRNVGPRVKNGMEAIRLGDSDLSRSDAHCVVKGNFFENCDGDPEVVSVKCCLALITGNTFRDCYGSLCLRHGDRSRVTHNVFVCTDGKPGVGGIRIYGCDHEVTHNQLTGLTGKDDEGPLVLGNGETDEGPLTARFRPQRVRIAHNTLTDCVYSSIDVGYDNDGKLTLPSLNCVIEHNTITSDSGTLVNLVTPTPTLLWRDNQLVAPGGGSCRCGDPR